jgi:hypothetical protein
VCAGRGVTLPCSRCHQIDQEPEASLLLEPSEYHALFVRSSTSRIRSDFKDLASHCIDSGSLLAGLRGLMSQPETKLVPSCVPMLAPGGARSLKESNVTFVCLSNARLLCVNDLDGIMGEASTESK